MIRKLIAVTMASVVSFALLPALPASAAPPSTASLVSASTVFPTATDGVNDGAADDTTRFSVTVANTGYQGFAGVIGADRPIDGVTITFPSSVSGASCDGIEGWDCVAINRAGPDGLILKNGSIVPGEDATFEFTGIVAAPRFEDLDGQAFIVDVSDDGGRSYDRAGSPAFDVHVLQTAAVAVSRTRLTGGRQRATATYRFTDHSRDGVPMDPALTVLKGPGHRVVRTRFTAASPLAGAPGSAEFAITTAALGGDGDGVQHVRLVAEPNAVGVVTETPGTGLTIETSPSVTLDVGSLRINDEYRSGIPAGAQDYVINIRGTKRYTPAVLAKGFTSRLRLEAEGIGPIVLPLTSDSVTQQFARGHDRRVDLTYATTAPISFPEVTETTGLDAVFEFSGKDDNGAPFDLEVPLMDLIDIEVSRPSVTIDDIYTENTARDRVKDGDQVTVEGTISSNRDDFDIDLPEGFHLTLTNGRLFSARTEDFDITYAEGNTEFTATYTIPTDADLQGNSFVLGPLGTLTAQAQVIDRTGNASPPAVGTLDIDNLLPMLAPRSGNANEDALAYYFAGDDPLTPRTETNPRVRVTFDEGGAFDDVVSGGCQRTAYSISGEAVDVYDVQYWDGTSCFDDFDGPDSAPPAGTGYTVNDRILILSSELSLGSFAEISVTYDVDGVLSFMPNDDVFDTTGNRALPNSARVVDNSIPPIPTISIFERGVAETEDTRDYEPVGTDTGCRNAGCDTSLDSVTNYYTNADVRAAVRGGRFGTDAIEILPIVDQTASGEARYGGPLVRVGYTEERFRFPLDSDCAEPCEIADQPYGVRFVREVPRGNGSFDFLEGPVREFLVTYDTVVPTLVSARPNQGDGDDVLVAFSEAIGAGTDSADDWSIEQADTDPNRPGDQNRFTRAQSVSPTDNPNERLIGATPLAGHDVLGALYELVADQFDVGARRYEDLAGNFAGDGTAPVEQWTGPASA